MYLTLTSTVPRTLTLTLMHTRIISLLLSLLISLVLFHSNLLFPTHLGISITHSLCLVFFRTLSLSITLCQLSAHSQNEQVYVGQKPMTHLGISLCYPYDFYSRSLQPQFRASVMPVTKILVPISTCL